MKKTIYTLIVISIITTALIGMSSFSTKEIHGGGIAIIVNKENPISSLSAGEVKLYWLRKIKKRWPELNKNIKPVDRKAKCPEQETFYSKILNMSAANVETYFIQKQYESAEKPQDKFQSDADIIEFVSSEPGAIGFISKNTSVGDNNVKIVLVVD